MLADSTKNFYIKPSAYAKAQFTRSKQLKQQLDAHERVRHSIGTIRRQLDALVKAFEDKGESAGTVREEDALKRRYMTLLHTVTDLGPAVDWLSGDHRSHYQKEGEKQ